MALDSFQETTSRSWFARISDSIKGILFGLILFVAAFPLLFWNEGRAVKTYKTLKEGSGTVMSVGTDRIDAANAGMLVHVTAKAVTDDELVDPEFGMAVTAIIGIKRVKGVRSASAAA